MEADMLAHNDIVATIAVSDMAKARNFYENQLGLKLEDTMGDGITTYKAGDSRVFVYKSDRAGDSKATVATWAVEDHIEDMVSELQQNGISFVHFDMRGVSRKGDIHVTENGMKAAWFKDPDGNILCLVQTDLQ